MTNPDPNIPRNLSAESSAEAAAWLGNSLGPEQQSNNDNVTNDIAAELADHLAESTAAARVKGLNEEQAKAHAAGRFGDVAAILRQCWWIKKGDAIMFRSAAIILGCICVIGLFAVAYSAWRIEASFTDQMGALSGQLAELNQTLTNNNANNALAQPVDNRPQITGKLYLGDPSVPAVGAEVEVWDAKSMDAPVREIRTDENGNYEIRDLPDGVFFLLASLMDDRNANVEYQHNRSGPEWPKVIRRNVCVQSAPITLWQKRPTQTCDLDVQYLTGKVVFEYNRPFDEEIVVGAKQLPIILNCRVQAAAHIDLPISPSLGTGVASWPQLGFVDYIAAVRQTRDATEARTNHGEPAYRMQAAGGAPWVPADIYTIHALIDPIRLSVNPYNGEARDLLPQRVQNSLRSKSSDISQAFHTESEDILDVVPDLESFTFEVRPNQLTRLRLILPDGYEEALQTAITREKWDEDEIISEFTPRPIRVELIGYEPIEVSE